MQIDIQILKDSINEQIQAINDGLSGKITPNLNKFDAINQLGTISAIVLGMYQKVENESEDFKEEIWNLKKESDTLLSKLFSELM
ncbi:hypothetical protein [Bacillus cereus group sp. TH152-1LC]|uniref:hypothetical protein n=1 Tax=Bacillus cereus group sp. TH152-1LC TaxID=3018060 RepID=UPI0022E3E51E|nr:hypothetical protein [Bacillus cereus group sp. TH152-1LC]MDA1675083.1 hypothetical protein [Bacillus cereus group sp. TH152-1LC]